MHLDDLVLRRTLLGMLGQLTRPALDELADIVGETLGWTAPQKKSETARTLRLLSERHGVVLDWGDGSQPLKIRMVESPSDEVECPHVKK